VLFFSSDDNHLRFQIQPKIRKFAKQPYNLFIHVINLFVCLMVVNATFKYISVISWRSVLLVEKQDDQEKTIDLYTSPRSRFELTTSVVIGSDCIESCKSNYHMPF
jgi:hypothetical protein